ncbi:hypothetical protein HanRHA438_Chr15g0696131 [Helianthus annuus]|nr:hypothetical protein HanRHA438_Chr15g0696131 [Helianthus annuus]
MIQTERENVLHNKDSPFNDSVHSIRQSFGTDYTHTKLSVNSLSLHSLSSSFKLMSESKRHVVV